MDTEVDPAVRGDRPMQIAIIGAGLAGSLLAALLSGRGHEVEVYEQRDDPRTTPPSGRSVATDPPFLLDSTEFVKVHRDLFGGVSC